VQNIKHSQLNCFVHHFFTSHHTIGYQSFKFSIKEDDQAPAIINLARMALTPFPSSIGLDGD